MEMCMQTGWTETHILKMPVRRFFALRRAMFDIVRENAGLNYAELCDIQSISLGDANYYKELRSGYMDLCLSPEDLKERNERRSNPRLFKLEDAREGAAFAGIMSDVFRQQSRLMGLR